MSATWKTVRVFISSTFRDMQAERDWLVKRVFPALRALGEAWSTGAVASAEWACSAAAGAISGS